MRISLGECKHASAVMSRKADHRKTGMISPYLSQPILPLAMALPRMLEEIETKLANKKIGAAEKWRLRLRAGLIRRLLAPELIT